MYQFAFTKGKNIFTVLALAVCCTASAQYKLTDKIPTSPDVKIGKLANGLTYYIRKNQKPEKKVELRLVVNAGSILEDDNQLGLAHFMEHMNFNGSTHFPKNELVNYLQTIGVKFGADLNAYTSFDETVYMLPIPSEKPEIVEKGFTVIEDWAGGATITDEEVNKERGVVLEELRSGKGAGERMRNKYFPKLLNGSKYADRLPIGTEDLLKNFKPELVRKFYKDWYRPDLMAVIVVGDIEVAEAEAKIKAHFGGLKNPANERPRPSTIPIKPRTIEEAMNVSDVEGGQTSIQIINYLKPSKTELTWADYREDMVKSLFSEMINARLQEQSQKPNPPYLFAFSGFSGFVRNVESYSSTAATGKGSVTEAITAMISENERVQKLGFTMAELERAKSSTLNGYEESSKEDGKTNSNAILGEYIRNFLAQEPMPGVKQEYAFVKQVLPSISLEEVNAVAKKMNAGQKPFVLITGPEKRDVPVPSNADLLSLINSAGKTEVKAYEEKEIAKSLMDKMPAGGAIATETQDADLGTTTITLKNGVSITLKPTTFKNDEIVMSATRFGGSSLYGDNDKFNATNASAVVSEMGVKDLSPTDLQKFLSGKTVSVSSSISETAEGFSGKSNIKELETMLQLIYLKATQPRMDKDLFASHISKQKSFWTGMMQNPQMCFSDTMQKVTTQNHPRGSSFMKPEDFDKINVDRAFNIYKERFSNMNGMKFFFVGSFDLATIKPLLVSYLGSLPSTDAKSQYKDLGVRAPKGNVKFTYNKGKEKKSLAIISFAGETKYDADENLQLQAATEVLQIKMIEKLREEMGGVYGAGIRGGISKVPYGKYSISASIPCGPENVDKLIAATMELIKIQKEAGPSIVDLDKVKETWRKKYDEDMKTNNYWLSALSAASTNGTDPKRLLTYKKRVDELTTDAVKAITIKYFNTDASVTGVLMPE